MLIIYRVVLPILLIIFVLMGLWVNFLHFASDWVMYIVMGLEVLAATIVVSMEYQAQNVGGASGWGFLVFLV
jgi:low affinity Fe/Cu permease